MPEFRKFIRCCSVNGLKQFFSKKEIQIDEIDWDEDSAVVTNKLLDLSEQIYSKNIANLKADVERIIHMSDEFGQAALRESTNDIEIFKKLESTVDRSLRVYLNESDNFRKAEDIKYTDKHRYGRDWSGYAISNPVPLQMDSSSIEAFKQELASMFGFGNRVKIEQFNRQIPNEDGEEISTVQLMLYLEGYPDSYLEFKNDEDIEPRIRRPVSEHAINYCPDTGGIEVVAAKQKCRDDIVKSFIQQFLKTPEEAQTVQVRRYNLSPLLENISLDYDPGDGIADVSVVMLKLKDISENGTVTIETPLKSGLSLYEYCGDHFKGSNPLSSGTFIPKQAKIDITFHPDNGSTRPKQLPVKITMPNKCDLRNRTEREKLIGFKYLKRWGLLEEI